MIKRFCGVLLAICIIFSICACTGKTSTEPSYTTALASTEPSSSQVGTTSKSFELPTENIRASFPSLHGIPATSSNGYYSGNKVLKYTDIDSKQTAWLCAQPGCTHSDSSCQAWIGADVVSMCEYQGVIYATVSEENGSMVLLKKDISTGQRTIIDRWELNGDMDNGTSIYLGVFSDGKCILYYTEMIRQFSEHTNMVQVVSDTQVFIYDLSTGQRKSLPDEFRNWSVYAMCGNRLLLAYSNHRMSEEEYLDWYGEIEGYQAYLDNYIPAEIRVYDMDTGKAETIATEDEGLILTADPCNSYGYTVIYQMGDDIWLYDLESDNSSVVISMERVINFWLMDHKIFLIQSFTEKSPHEGFCIYYLDMDGGEPIRLENEGATDSMHFSITWEGNGFFAGNYNGQSLIHKEDFYAEFYDQAWSGGY